MSLTFQTIRRSGPYGCIEHYRHGTYHNRIGAAIIWEDTTMAFCHYGNMLYLKNDDITMTL